MQKHLSTRDYLIARDALKKIKIKRQKATNNNLHKAKRQIQITENKLKNAIKDTGVTARKAEKSRLIQIKAN